jgi:uncharacterized SAM-binding protein YcdF (DUF218 family)
VTRLIHLADALYHTAVGLTRPYTLLFLLTGLAVLNLWRRRKESRRRLLALTASFGLLYALTTPLAGHLLVGSLEWQYPPLQEVPADADAVVVLSGGMSPPDRVRPKGVLGDDTLLRCMQGADDHRRGRGIPILVTGGRVRADTPGPPVAELMRDFLVGYGVKPADVLVEAGARTTYENAVLSARILKQRGFKKAVLVTDATHLPRAVRCFRAQGVAVVPSGCRYRATRRGPFPLILFPNPDAARGVLEAMHEWVGLVWYTLHGRV